MVTSELREAVPLVAFPEALVKLFRFRVAPFRWPLTTIKSTLRQFRSPLNSLS